MVSKCSALAASRCGSAHLARLYWGDRFLPANSEGRPLIASKKAPAGPRHAHPNVDGQGPLVALGFADLYFGEVVNDESDFYNNSREIRA